jgi:deoxyribodipyrimidine photo-lyase
MRRIFQKYLLDYDEVVNIGNRQRSASVGADPKPMRIFSPIRQSQRFDPDAIFIKKYLPQLKNINPEHIHDPLTYKLDYCKPIVDHKQQTILAKQMYFK